MPTRRACTRLHMLPFRVLRLLGRSTAHALRIASRNSGTVEGNGAIHIWDPDPRFVPNMLNGIVLDKNVHLPGKHAILEKPEVVLAVEGSIQHHQGPFLSPILSQVTGQFTWPRLGSQVSCVVFCLFFFSDFISHLHPSHLAYFRTHPIVFLAMRCWRRHASAPTLLWRHASTL